MQCAQCLVATIRVTGVIGFTHAAYQHIDPAPVRERSGQDPLKVLDKALHNIMPVLEVRPRRVGGATYQVPIEVRQERRTSLGLRWLEDYARQRKDKRTMTDKLVAEILDASNGAGGAVKKREDTHRMAEANKAFAHYRW